MPSDNVIVRCEDVCRSLFSKEMEANHVLRAINLDQ